MKNWAIVALCLFSSFASANEMEEIVVKARQVRIVLQKLSDVHVQDPVTKEWHYVERQEKENEKA